MSAVRTLVKQSALLVALCGLATASACDRSARGKASSPGSGAGTYGQAAGVCAPLPPGTAAVSPLDAKGTGSTVALARWSKRTLAFVSDEDDQAIHVIDVAANKQLSTTPLDGKPSQLLFVPDGRLVVAMRDQSQLQVLAPGNPNAPMQRRCTVETPVEPIGLALTPDARTLLVASGWGRALGAYDADGLDLAFEVDIARSPRAVTVSDDGRTAFVAHAAGGHISAVALSGKHEVSELSLGSRRDHQIARMRRQLRHRAAKTKTKAADLARQEATLLTSMGKPERDSCQGFALAKAANPDGRILAPHTMADSGEATQRTTGYGNEHTPTEVPGVVVIDEQSAAPLTASLAAPNPWQIRRSSSGEVREQCILPRSAVVDDRSQTLLVGCFGMDAVVAYDAASANPARAEVERWRVASGPTGIAVDASARRAIVWSQFDRTLNTISLAKLGRGVTTEPTEVVQLELRQDPARKLSIAERLGRRLFHATEDSRIAADGRACASCHPDGRDDGLVWSTPNGPRRTIMLAGRVGGTAPYGWNGDAETIKHHLGATFKRLKGVGGLRSVELDALVEYIQSLEPPPSARVHQRDAEVERGAKLFASAETGCARCHSGATLTDNQNHDVKSQVEADRTGEFETPSLRYVSGRGPFFHDGRYESLRDLLVKSDGAMGNTKHLSPDQLDALVAYLETL